METRSPISLEECQQTCIKYDSQCQTIQYDYYRKICEVYSMTSPLKMNSTTAEIMQKREIALGNTECALASLAPTIGSTHLIPQWECISKHIAVNERKQPVFQAAPLPTSPPLSVRTPPVSVNSHQPLNHTSPSKELYLRPTKLSASNIDGGHSESTKDVAIGRIDDGSRANMLRNYAVEVLPVLPPDCPTGEHSRIQIIEGVEVALDATLSFIVTLPEQCVQACRLNTFPGGTGLPLLCRSAHLHLITGNCSLYSDAINPNGFMEYKPNQKVIYIEKICIPDLVLPLACDDVFRRIPQHILLGQATEVISVASEQECILECIKSKINRAISCQSILHYPDVEKHNCILNVHTRHTKTQYFTPELAYKVDYVELGDCITKPIGGRSGHLIQTSEIVSIPKNPFANMNDKMIHKTVIGTSESEWSEWTKCNEDTASRSRQRECIGCNEIIQFVPCFTSNKFDVALQKFIKEQQQKEENSSITQQKSISSMDTKPVVIEFPQKDVVIDPKTSVEFFGPPQSPQKTIPTMNTY